MSQELGKIHKPEAEAFKKGRRLFVVPLIYMSKESPPEYIELFEQYWNQVSEQLTNLELKIGRISRTYHESIGVTGEDGLTVIERINPKSYQIIKEKCALNASFEAIEDQGLADENMDWERCLLLGFLSDTAAQKVSELFIESSRKRYEHIGKRIDETLGADEIGVLFIREGHSVQFTKDVEVFSVAPPALDSIHRWFRSRAASMTQEQDTGKEKQSDKNTGG